MSLKRKTHEVKIRNKKPKVAEFDEEDVNDDLDPKAFANSLSNLKNTDPEFYQFLEENDRKLLNFKVDSDSDDADEQAEDDGEEDEEDLHKPDADLQNDSEDSDFEDEAAPMPNKLTLKTIASWQEALTSDRKIDVGLLSNIIQAFHSALDVVTGDESEGGELKVEGAGVFNSVIQTCVLYLQPALKRVLGMKDSDKNPSKCKRWIKVKGLIRAYFQDLFKLLGGVTSTNILNVLLKHLHQMSIFLKCFTSLSKTVFKRLTILWSSSEETIRVLAFLCILRITRNNQPALLDSALKMMYMSYVKNCKFVSPATKPGISFMRRSLIEMFALDLNVSYQHVFLYVRQLAIHLRNAIILHKKENIQVVYNWQFVNSLQLWGELLAATKSKPQLQSLVYPLVMIITNAIKLNPTAQYYPLRFHCVQILINLSRDAEVFIPILPFLLEVLTSYDFNKKHKKVSMKPQNFTCILRVSKALLNENGFKDAVVENIYSQLLETLCIYSHTISFPDVVIPCVIQLKHFLKTCVVANFCRKIRMVLDKIEENVRFVEKARKNVSFKLSDTKAIRAWETNLLNSGTPLQTFHDNLKMINISKTKKQETKNHDIADKLPMIVKRMNKPKNDGPVELFPSDSEDMNDDFVPEPVKKKKDKKNKRKPKAVEDLTVENDDGDDVQDFNMVDW